MNTNTYKTIAYRQAAQLVSGDDIALLASIIYYNIYNKTGSDTDIYTSAKSVSNSCYDAFNNIKDNYVSYIKACNYYKKRNCEFSSLEHVVIQQIYILLFDYKELMMFDPKSFDTTMYTYSSISNKEMSYLKYVHKYTMSKIFYYYRIRYGITTADFKICSAELSEYIGKSILFKINNIANPYILADIRNGNITIDYVSVSITDSAIELITK